MKKILTAFILALAAGASAQVAVLGTPSTNVHSSGATITVSHTVSSGSNTLLLVAASCVNDAGTETVNSMTWGADAMTNLGEWETGNDNQISIWYLKSPTAATRTITATYNATLAEGGAIIAITLENVDQTTTFGTPVVDCAQTSPVPTNSVSSNTGDMVVDFVSCESCDGWTAGSGQTQYGNLNSDPTFSASSVEAGAASVEMAWTWDQGAGSEHRCQVGTNILQAAASGASGQTIIIRSSDE